MFFLLHKHTDDGVFDDFPKISDHFPKIFEDFPKLLRGTFPNIFRKFPRIPEDFRGPSRKTRRCFDDTQTNLSTIYETNWILVKSSISSHVRISYCFYQLVTTRYTTDFYIIKMYSLATFTKSTRYLLQNWKGERKLFFIPLVFNLCASLQNHFFGD